MQNAFVELFNGSFRDQLLNETLFSSLTEAREKIVAWKEGYNCERYLNRDSLRGAKPRR